MDKDYRVRILNPKTDTKELQRLFVAAGDYFMQFEKRVVKDNEAEEFFLEKPENTLSQNKHTFGLFLGNTLVAAVDWISDYPIDSHLFLGLLLVHPEYRGRGLATLLFKKTYEKLKTSPQNSVHLYVELENVSGIQFWKSLGFEEKHSFINHINGNPVNFIEMTLS